MGTTDPRLLINALADLQDECARWATEARDNLEEAHHVQRRQEEVVQLAHRRALIATNEAEDDRDKVERALDDAAALLSQCQDAQHTATDLLAASQEALQIARQTLATWEAELEKALEWLARALARLEAARAELAAAEWALQAAKSNLDDAIWALRRCKGDEKRSNCWPEQAAVQAAQQQVQSAEYRRGLALEEVNAAEEEVEQAQARVACCQQAVAFAGKAVQAGVEAVGRAEQALVAAEKSLDEAQAASKLAHKAKVDVDAELAEAEQMVIATRHAERFAYEAERSRRRADDANQTAQRLLAGSQHELTYRVRQLALLNQPEIVGGGLFGSRAGGRTASASAPDSATQFRDAKGRNILIRTSGDAKAIQLNAYDPSDGPTAGFGIGRATGAVETSDHGVVRLRLNNVDVSSAYRKAGISNQLLKNIEAFAKKNGASEIYGSIEDEEARNYWLHQASKGWFVRTSGAYGEVYKKL